MRAINSQEGIASLSVFRGLVGSVMAISVE